MNRNSKLANVIVASLAIPPGAVLIINDSGEQYQDPKMPNWEDLVQGVMIRPRDDTDSLLEELRLKRIPKQNPHERPGTAKRRARSGGRKKPCQRFNYLG